MTTTKLMTAAAVLTALIATPALAKDMKDTSASTTKSHAIKHTMKTNRMKTNHMAMRDRDATRSNARYDGNGNMVAGYDRNDAYARGSYTRGDSGFYPVDAAAGIVGGAVATAGAIATAPFGNGYYNNGYYNNGYASNVAYNNGFYDNGYGVNRGYRGSYASVDNYPRVGAYATAPYTNPYAPSNYGHGNDGVVKTFAQRNAFVCTPGSVFTNENGIRTLCQ